MPNGHGVNSQGNTYNTPGGTNSSSGSSYHYSNSNGSYYYSNDNGSTCAPSSRTPWPSPLDLLRAACFIILLVNLDAHRCALCLAELASFELGNHSRA